MKKLGRFLTTIALSAPLLSGCSFLSIFSNLPEETKDVFGLELRDHATSVALNTKYEFNGKVFLKYKDSTEKEVTSYCTFRDVDTSKVGNSDFRVDYETKSTIYYTVASISVYDPNDKGALKSISVSNYTDTVEKGATYTFDGKIFAQYEKVSKPVEVNASECTISTINTSTSGDKNLSITYQGKTANATIHVIAKPTAISAEAIQVGLNRTAEIKLTFTPSDTTEKDVTYVSADPSIASVDDDGVVTGKTAGKSTTITVTSKANTNVKTTVSVSVVDIQQDKWTILVYMCGANLESDTKQGGAATLDLEEIAKVSGQPSDVNVVVQAGGATRWDSKYSSVIKVDNRNRIHLKNNNYVRDDSLSQAKENMGAEATLKSFVKWGLQEYPAEKVGLIFWNHGGAMAGCCGDEQFSNDYLCNDEVVRAIRAAKSEAGYSSKFEFIGYDCCLMQVQDIAGTNSEFAKYMIASEASEWGYGWNYEAWIDDVYAGNSTETILNAVVDGFRDDTDEAYEYWSEENDQTLSYLDLSKWSAYQTAWDDMILAINITSKTAWNSFTSIVNKSFAFENGDYDTFDVGSFITKMKSSSYDTSVKNKVTSLQSAYSDLVKKTWHGNAYTDAQVTGLCLFCPINGSISKSDYNTTATPFGAYRTACVNYGWSSYY